MDQENCWLSKILIVNDSKFKLNFIKSLLMQHGFHNLITAKSAIEAIQRMEGLNGEEELTPDLILMNLFMPKMDGIEACRRIKSIKKLHDIPIIIITSSDGDQQIKKAFEAGATDFVPIPIREVELIARMQTALRLKSEMDQRKAREEDLRQVMKQLNEANQRLEALSYTDGLTGIYNRRYFDETLSQEWIRSIRFQRKLSLIMIDIDYFKRYNDRYGHQLGDKCLQQVASVLKGTVRGSDIVARYGGEEFVVILPETDKNGVLEVAQKLLQNVYELQVPHEDSEASPYVTISAGCCTMTPQSEMDMSELITIADQALYQAKKQGRNQVCFAD